MSEAPEVPDEEPSESKPDMKERMRTFGEKAKAFGEKTGQRSKEIGKKVAEATKGTTAKAAEATKKTTAKMAEAAKETTAKAAEASKKAGTRLSESTADVSEKISVAAEQAVESVSKSVKQTKEKVKQAKEARDERKAQAAQVPQSTQVIALGPDLPDASREISTIDESKHSSHDLNDKDQSAVKTPTKQFVIVPPTDAVTYPNVPRKPALIASTRKRISSWGKNILDYGPDLVFGWTLLFVLLSTSANAVSILADTTSDLVMIPFGIPHMELGFGSTDIWVQYLCSILIVILLFDSILLSFAPARRSSYSRISALLSITWFVPAVANGTESVLTPFETSDMIGFFWHIFILPILVLGSLSRSSVLHEEMKQALPQPDSTTDLEQSDSTSHMSSSFSYTPTLDSLPELRPMNAPDGLLDKPKRRDKMEFYEWVFFLFMWLFIFAGVAMGVMAAQANDAANSVLESSYMPAIGLCLGLAVILAYILFKMDRAARSGIDMAKRRERFHAMQDEVWETWRTEARLKREQLEQEHNEGMSSVTA